MRIHWFVGLCLLAGTGVIFAEDAPKLPNLKSIYVGSLGDDDAAPAVRSAIIDQFAKSGRMTVVESPELADAVLSGQAQMTKTVEAPDPYAVTSSKKKKKARHEYHAYANVQVKDKGQNLLWSKDETYNSTSHDASKWLGEKIAKNIVKAMPKEEKEKKN